MRPCVGVTDLGLNPKKHGPFWHLHHPGCCAAHLLCLSSCGTYNYKILKRFLPGAYMWPKLNEKVKYIGVNCTQNVDF